MQYRFFLDNTLLADEPHGWQDFVLSVKRYNEFKGVLITQDTDLTFAGDGFTYLKSVFDSDNVCSLVKLKIEYECTGGSFEEFFRGHIFLSALKFDGNQVKAKIEDDSFFARINNNKNIKLYLGVDRSKNNQVIAAAAPIEFQMFDPCDCSNLGGTKSKGWTIYSAFRNIILYISDGEVGCLSDAFNTGGKWEGHCIAKGYELSTPGTTDQQRVPYISFEELFSEVDKKYNIGMAVEYVGASAFIRIEPIEYFYDNATAVTLADPNHVKYSIDQSTLYAKVEVGSDVLADFDDCGTGGHANFPENVDYSGFKKEEFALLTECNIDESLNLVSSWVISSNVIQLALNGTKDYDDDMFFIEAAYNSGTGFYDAVQTDIFNDGNCFYNAFYTNINTLQRWGNSLPNSLFVNLGNTPSTFDAYRSSSSAFINLAAAGTYTTLTTDGYGHTCELFDDDYNFGYDGVYGPGSPNNYGASVNPVVHIAQGTPLAANQSIYIVPINGNMRFYAGYKLISIFQTSFIPLPGILTGNIEIKHYTSGGALINSYSDSNSVGPISSSIPSSLIVAHSTPIIPVAIGDYLSVEYSITCDVDCKFRIGGYDDVGNLTYFSGGFQEGYGGTLTRTQSPEYKNILFEYEYPLSYEQYKSIKADTKKLIQFNWCGKDYTGWVKDIKYRPHGISTLQLLTSKNNFKK